MFRLAHRYNRTSKIENEAGDVEGGAGVVAAAAAADDNDDHDSIAGVATCAAVAEVALETAVSDEMFDECRSNDCAAAAMLSFD
jgi:hypothetical protein